MLFPLLRTPAPSLPSTYLENCYSSFEIKPKISSSRDPSWIPHRKVMSPSSLTQSHCCNVLCVLTWLSLSLDSEPLKAETLSQLSGPKAAQRLEWTLRKYLWNAKGWTGRLGEGDYQGHLSALALKLKWCLEHSPILVTKEETVGSSLQSGFPRQSKLSWRGQPLPLLFSTMKLFRGEPYLQEIPMSLFYCYPPTVMTPMGLNRGQSNC